MQDNEFTNLSNIDLGERGSLKRRTGMTSHLVSPVSGKGQGYFRYYLDANTFHEILAVNGKIYKDGVEIVITNLTSFQTERPIEAVQYKDKLYIATGSKLVVYDGTTAKVIEPYAPEPLEALYVGTNGLAADPDNFMQDSTGATTRIDGVTFSSRYGRVNESVTMTAYVTLSNSEILEYKFEERRPEMKEGFWEIGQDWSTSKSYTFTADYEGDLQFRVWIREQGTTVELNQYIVPKYKIKPVTDPADDEVNTSTIHSCNRIILHWDRLVMYGDPTNYDVMYISHLKKPDYFPVPNSLRFDNGRQEGITKIIQYRDTLITFTPTTIQAVYGKSPLDFQRITINSGIGCIAPASAKIMKNYVTFLSKEGIHVLKTIGYSDNKANVEKIDVNINNLVSIHDDACAVIHDNQYHILFPRDNKRLRFYIDWGIWTKDESTKLDFDRFYEFDGVLLGQSSTTGNVLKFDDSVYTDDGLAYTDEIEFSYMDFGKPYHEKKLKELQMLYAPTSKDANVSVTMYTDTATISNLNVDGTDLDENGNTVRKLRTSGKCRSVKLKAEHSIAEEHWLLGIGFVFKSKKP